MSNKTATVQDIADKFGYGNSFSSKELYDFYKQYEEDLKESTFRWRVYELKKEGLLQSVKRGVYVLGERKRFQPKISRSTKMLYNRIKNEFPYIEVCVWDTSWLDDFMNHQIYSSITIFEVDRDVVSSVFNMLSEKKDKVFMNPSESDVENYILGNNAIVVRSIVKEAPAQNSGNTRIPKLEKILVDLYFDKTLLVSYQGYEMKNIYSRSFEEYGINLTTLYRYARNRGIKDKVQAYVQKEIGIITDDREVNTKS